MRKKPSELDFDEYIRQVEPTKREKFFRNLLMGEHNELKNRYLHVDYKKPQICKNVLINVPSPNTHFFPIL